MNWVIGSVTAESANLHGEPYSRSISITSKPHQFFIIFLGTADGRDYYYTSCTLDGEAMTDLGSIKQDATDGRATMHARYIDVSNWPTGTYTLYYNVGTGGSPDYGGLAFYLVSGSDGNDLLEDTAVVAGTADPTGTVTTTVENTLIVDAFYSESGSNLTCHADQTSLWQIDPESSGNRFGGSYKVVKAAGDYTMSWAGVNNRWAQISAAFNIAHNGGGGIVLRAMLIK